MLKRKRVGMIVWGAIIVLFSILIMLSYQDQDKSNLILGGIVMAGGFGLLVPGIILAAKVSVANNRILNENEGFTYVANCLYCGRPVSCKFQDFQNHKRYPEGFLYCPICKHPISRNVFVKVLDQGRPY